MKTIYAQVHLTGIDKEFGTINAHFDGEKISASIGDYTIASWAPQGEITATNNAPDDYGPINDFGQRMSYITAFWWRCQQPEILSALFGSKSLPSPSEEDYKKMEEGREEIEGMRTFEQI